MNIIIFSDLHGNLPALERLLKENKNVDKIISLGDNINYGPWGNECVTILNDIKCYSLMGNHEEYFVDGEYNGKSAIVKSFFNFCYEKFQEFSIIRKYKKTLKIRNFYLSHTLKNKKIYKDTNIKLFKNHIIGHSHQQFKISRNNFMLINPGSLGQDREFINRSSYIKFNTEKNIFKMESFLYNSDLLINEMVAKKYPKVCIEYYKSKKKIC